MDPIGIQTIKVDLIRKSLIQNSQDKSVPTFIEGDTNRLVFDLYTNGIAADLSNVGRAVANFKSGTNVYSRLATVNGSQATYDLGVEESALPGLAEVELQLYNADNTQRVTTIRVKVYIAKAIGEVDISPANPEYTVLQELFIEVDDAVASALAAGDYARAQGDAVDEKVASEVATQVPVAVDTKVSSEVATQVPVAVDEKVGQLTNLQTEDKSSVVGAVNEVTSQLADTAKNLDLANAKHPLQIITYLNDNQITHPKVIYFADKWNGYNYWMAYTAYQNGASSNENPCIAVSNDGVNWLTPNGLKNPIVGTPSGGYNSDTHIFMVGNTMHLWYREAIGETTTIYEHTSTNGVNWSERRIVQRFDSKVKDWVSPACIYENGMYKVWFGDVGRVFKYVESSDGVNWVNERTLDLGFEDMGLKTWHYDVEKTDQGYEFLITAHKSPGESYDETELYHVVSPDNETFSTPKKIIARSKKPVAFDNQAIYRSCMVKVEGVYMVYYSGWQKPYKGKFYRALGLSTGESLYELRGLDFTAFYDAQLYGKLNLKNGAYLYETALQLVDDSGNQVCLRGAGGMAELRKTIFSSEYLSLWVKDVRFAGFRGANVQPTQINLQNYTGELKLCLGMEPDGTASIRETSSGSYKPLRVAEVTTDKVTNVKEVKLLDPGVSGSKLVPSDKAHAMRVKKDGIERMGGLDVKYLYLDNDPLNTMPDVEGAIRYNPDTKKHQGYDGTTWHDLY